MSQTLTIESQQDVGEIIHDKTALNMKHHVMDKMKWNALLGSINDACKFFAGPLFAIGASSLIPVIAASVGGPAVSPIILPLAIGLMAVAVVTLSIAVATGYAATRIWQSGQFDNFEINAESTARHLVQELKTSRVSMVTEHEQNGRADGKKWVQVVKPEQQPPVRNQTT